jgi:hypothetical protein
MGSAAPKQAKLVRSDRQNLLFMHKFECTASLPRRFAALG